MEVEATTTATLTTTNTTTDDVTTIVIDEEINTVTEDLEKLNFNERLLSEPYYPSPGIEQLFLDATAVSKKLMTQLAFDRKYKIETEFTQMEVVNFLVDFYKINRTQLTTTKELLIPMLDELKKICLENNFEFIKCSNFLRWLEFRRQKQCHTFLAFTKRLSDKPEEQQKGYFDLDEHPNQYKRKTILECGCCKKLEKLQLCNKCHTAAYCNSDCQKKDFSFHKRYCKAREGYVAKCNKK